MCRSKACGSGACDGQPSTPYRGFLITLFCVDILYSGMDIVVAVFLCSVLIMMFYGTLTTTTPPVAILSSPSSIAKTVLLAAPSMGSSSSFGS